MVRYYSGLDYNGKDSKILSIFTIVMVSSWLESATKMRKQVRHTVNTAMLKVEDVDRF